MLLGYAGLSLMHIVEHAVVWAVVWRVVRMIPMPVLLIGLVVVGALWLISGRSRSDVA